MKKFIIIFICILISIPSYALAAKYTVNTKGSVKNTKTGVTVHPQTQIKNYYNNYNATNYANTNQVNATQVQFIDIVMDYSGSMGNWIGVAKSAMTTIVNQIPDNVNIGFRVFGHSADGKNDYQPILGDVKSIQKVNGKYEVVTKKSFMGITSGACSATQQMTTVQPKNLNALLNGMSSADIGGATPLVYALERAVSQDLSSFNRHAQKKIILITDGIENCGGDPCEFARNLMSKRNDIHIDVLLVSPVSVNLNCIATITGGHVYSSSNPYEFSKLLQNSITSTPTKIETTTPQNNQQEFEFINN